MLSKQQPFAAHWAGVMSLNPQLLLLLGAITHISKGAQEGAKVSPEPNSSLFLPTPRPASFSSYISNRLARPMQTQASGPGGRPCPHFLT